VTDVIARDGGGMPPDHITGAFRCAAALIGKKTEDFQEPKSNAMKRRAVIAPRTRNNSTTGESRGFSFVREPCGLTPAACDP